MHVNFTCFHYASLDIYSNHRRRTLLDADDPCYSISKYAMIPTQSQINFNVHQLSTQQLNIIKEVVNLNINFVCVTHLFWAEGRLVNLWFDLQFTLKCLN